MIENTLQVIFKGKLSLSALLDALKLKTIDYNELAAIDSELSLSSIAHEFPVSFLNYLRSETEWLFKDQTPPEETPKNAKLQTPDGNNSNLSELGSPPAQFDSGQKQKNRGILKVNISPIQSPDNVFFKNSTPQKSQQAFGSPALSSTPVSFYSSPGASPVFPSPSYIPSKARGRNLYSERIPNDSPKSKSKLSLGDFISPTSSKKGKGRRIKPTQVSSVINESENVFMNAPEVSPCSITERQILKKDCENLQQLMSNLTTSTLPSQSKENNQEILATPPKLAIIAKPLPSSKKPEEIIPIEPEDFRKLDILAQIYYFILKNNLCDNIMMELHFLMTLVAKTDVEEDNVSEKLFGSLRKCIQFAVLTLAYIKEIVLLLSPPMLDLLAVSPAIKQLSPSLHVCLTEAFHNKLIQSSGVIDVAPGGNVSFQCDTDNIDNFSSHLNFTSFRKQRDEFYKLLQQWEADHSIVNWPSKVKYIISIRDVPTNMMHLARLFRNQLLASCTNAYNSPLDDSENNVLQQLLPSVDKGKVSRLEARLTDQKIKNGPVPKPGFNGREIFFKNFIEGCGPSGFISFLQLALLDELMKLNEVEFFSEGEDNFADELTQKRYLECLTSTRLLSKFLAFTEFLPYQVGNKEELPEPIIRLHCKMRDMILPLFNAEHVLLDAVKSCRLVLTVPWLVSYMSMMDQVTARLSAYNNIWNLLAGIHKNIPENITPAGRLLLQLNLGWLFDVSSIPELKPTPPDTASDGNGLDELEVVSESALYASCPYLSELNAVLMGNAATASRHIRPTPQLESKNAETLAKRQLELRLEESFLQNQTPSTRKTIQYVADRVASCCIKMLINDVLPSVRDRVCEETLRKFNNGNLSLQKTEVLQFAVNEWQAQVKASTPSAIWDVCFSRSKISLRCLLSSDVGEGPTQVACNLAVRQAMEKVNNWMQTHILSNVGRREAKSALESQLFSVKEKKLERDIFEALKAVEPPAYLSDTVYRLQKTGMKALHGVLTPEVLTETTRIASAAVAVEDIYPTIERHLLTLVSDLLLFIFIRNTQLIPLAMELIPVLHKLHVKTYNDGPLNRLFCPRNVEFINNETECQSLMNLIYVYLKADVLSIDAVKNQVSRSLEMKGTESQQPRLSTIAENCMRMVNRFTEDR